MGCRTGMYAVFSEEPTGAEVVEILQKMYQWIAELPDDYEIPGATATECGNYSDHNLLEAKEDARKYFEIMKAEKELGKYNYL